MKKFLICFVFLSIIITACSINSKPNYTQTSEPTFTQEPTNTLGPTETLEPTSTQRPTISIHETRKSLTPIIQASLTNPNNNFKPTEVTWEENVLKIKGTLENFFTEPKDHGFLHFAIIQALTESDSLLSFMDENTKLQIVTEGKLSNTQTLSITNYKTIEKIYKGDITTEVEWLYEAEIVVK